MQSSRVVTQGGIFSLYSRHAYCANNTMLILGRTYFYRKKTAIVKPKPKQTNL